MAERKRRCAHTSTNDTPIGRVCARCGDVVAVPRVQPLNERPRAMVVHGRDRYTVELRSDKDKGTRIDIWRNVLWIEQRVWIPNVGAAGTISHVRGAERVSEEIVGRLAHELRSQGH